MRLIESTLSRWVNQLQEEGGRFTSAGKALLLKQLKKGFRKWKHGSIFWRSIFWRRVDLFQKRQPLYEV